MNISNYTLHRRERNWFGNVKREKGGVAIYTRVNINMKRVQKSKVYGIITLKIELSSCPHQMLFCGIYHPPKPKYLEGEFIDYDRHCG